MNRAQVGILGGAVGFAALLAGCSSDKATGVPDAAASTPDAPVAVDPRCESTPIDATFTAHLRITTDDECEVFVNGTSVGLTTSWTSPVTFDVGLFLHPSRENVVAIRGTNRFEQNDRDRGIVGELTYEVDSVATALVVTDAAWKVSAAAEEAGWTDLAFDDSAWVAATEIAAHGEPPWGNILTTTSAKWIWSAPVPVDVADKPDVETAFARRTFYFGLDGTTIGDSASCP
jgi:hypothetical protein